MKKLSAISYENISAEIESFAKQETLDLMLSASDFYGDSGIPKNCHGLWCAEYAVSVVGHDGNTNAGSANLVGETALEYSSTAYIQNDAASGELTAVVIFAAVSVINLIILIVEGILKLAKKDKKMPAGKAIFAGQLAKLVTAVLVIISLLFAFGSGMLTVLCIIAGLCALVCLVSAAAAAKAVVTEKEMKVSTRVCYTVFVLCSVFVTGFIVYFRLFNFWA